MVDHLVFYVIHLYVIYIVVDHPCAELFFEACPQIQLHCQRRRHCLISVLNSKRQSCQCLQNKNRQSSGKVSTFFFMLSVFEITLFQRLHFIGKCWLLWRHTTPTTAQTFCMLFMDQIDLKMHINEQIITKWCGEFKYECLKWWLSKELATDTWKVCHGKHSYFLINAGTMDSGGLVRKPKGGIDLVHNKYNATFLGLLADHRTLFYKI